MVCPSSHLGANFPSDLIGLIIECYLRVISRLYRRSTDAVLVVDGLIQSMIRIPPHSNCSRDLKRLDHHDVRDIGVYNQQLFQSNREGRVIGHRHLPRQPICRAVGDDSHLGNFYTCLDHAGHLTMWGSDHYGQLGQGDGWGHLNYITLPVQVDLPTVVKVDHGEFHTIALTDQGDVYAWGQELNRQAPFNVSRPRKITMDQLDQSVVDIACGGYLTAIVTQSGHLYHCGELAGSPQLVLVPIDGHVVAVSCGHSHIMALTRDGRLFGLGDNQSGQLGLVANGEDTDLSKHHHTSAQLVLNQVRSVKCRGDYTLAIRWDGTLYEWCQLSHNARPIRTPTKYQS